jgi:ribosome maturation factor RimP
LERSEVTKHVAEIAGKVAADAGTELVHVETAGTKRDMVVRVYIDKEGGVTLGDCSTVSRGIEDVLDAEDFIPSHYVLEVSSPGIERDLYSLADFVKFTGQLAKVKITREIGGQRNFVGRIISIEGERITLEDRTQGEVSFEYGEVSKANLKIDLSKEFGHK